MVSKKHGTRMSGIKKNILVSIKNTFILFKHSAIRMLKNDYNIDIILRNIINSKYSYFKMFKV